MCRFICSGEDITQCAGLFAVVRKLLSVRRFFFSIVR